MRTNSKFSCPFTDHFVHIEGDTIILRPALATPSSTSEPILTHLHYTSTKRVIKTPRGSIPKSRILGKQIRDVVYTTKGIPYRIHEVTLDEYVRLSERIVTPIYPQDASLIVQLLDLHPQRDTDEYGNGRPFEIFEAGTGHGSLTLYLARALYLMNETPPDCPSVEEEAWKAQGNLYWEEIIKSGQGRAITEYGTAYLTDEVIPLAAFKEDKDDVGEGGIEKDAGRDIAVGENAVADDAVSKYAVTEDVAVREGAVHDELNLNEDSTENQRIKEQLRARREEQYASYEKSCHRLYKQHQAFEQWRKERRAVISTLDINDRHARHAKKTIQQFRRGIYSSVIDFYVGTIDGYLSSRLEDIAKSSSTATETPFLEHAILDLPSSDNYLEIVSRCLKPNGCLVVFCPSITQINKCVLKVKNERLPLLLDKVLEIGAGIGVGGREWDVRAVLPRSLARAREQSKKSRHEDEDEVSIDSGIDLSDKDVYNDGSVQKPVEKLSSEDEGWEMICRPKVGGKISGGGFIAVFRGMKPTEEKREILPDASSTGTTVEEGTAIAIPESALAEEREDTLLGADSTVRTSS